MNLPTKLTVLRMVLIPVFVVLFFLSFPYNRFYALGVFALASFTDFLDGYIARKNNQVTTLGKFLDPIADKILVSSALFAVVIQPTTPPLLQTLITVFAMIIIARELMVSCFRIVASSKNVILAADIWGKFKTVFQMLSLILLIPYGSILSIGTQAESAANIVLYVGFGLLAVATLLTIFSGINYIAKNKSVLKD